MTTRCLPLVLLGLTLVTGFRPALADDARFLRLDAQGQPLPATAASKTWPCVLDRRSGLIWEVKTRQAGLHQRDQTFSWGEADKPGATDCAISSCNTRALIDATNRDGWCGAHDWRLPRREELRTLADYRIPYPGPMLDSRYFPNAVAQFYWSATPSASNRDEAWGIGFAFGFDYAYPKGNRVHVRLVRGASPVPANAAPRLLQPHADGNVTAPHLRWQRCSVGQKWTGTDCRGKAQRLTQAQAQKAASDGWRLPSLQELSALADLRVSEPAIDATLFPHTPAGDFWTATRFTNSPAPAQKYWQVQFIYGETNLGGAEDRAYLRLVRDAD